MLKFNSFQRAVHFLSLATSGEPPEKQFGVYLIYFLAESHRLTGAGSLLCWRLRNWPLALSQNVKSCFLPLEFSISGIDLVRVWV